MTQDTPIETGTLDYDTEEAWLEEPEEELPRRPRRRLLGVGRNPIPVTLLVVLLLACAFFAGVEVEKGQTSSGSGTGLPAGFAGLRGRLAAGSTSSGSSARSSSGGGFPGAGGAIGSGAGGFPGVGGLAGGGVTIGEVSFASGDTLYVTSGEGNTIKVTVPAGTKVSKTVTTNVRSVHPGDTVIVRGSQNKNGSFNASSIAVSASGGSGTGGSSASGGVTQQLFGAG